MGIASSFRCLPSSEARGVYGKLNSAALVAGLVPSIEELVVVSDSDSVLTSDEKRIITTGLEDEQLRATYDLMLSQLRLVLRFGYSRKWEGEDYVDYLRRQIPWRNQSVDLLRQKLGREPTHVEIGNDYASNALFFHIRELFLHPEKAIQERYSLPIPSEPRILDILAGGDYYEFHSCSEVVAA